MNTIATLIPTWGYHASEQARIFELKPGEGLPEGWHDSPAKVKVEPAPRAAKPARRRRDKHQG